MPIKHTQQLLIIRINQRRESRWRIGDKLYLLQIFNEVVNINSIYFPMSPTNLYPGWTRYIKLAGKTSVIRWKIKQRKKTRNHFIIICYYQIQCMAFGMSNKIYVLL